MTHAKARSREEEIGGNWLNFEGSLGNLCNLWIENLVVNFGLFLATAPRAQVGRVFGSDCPCLIDFFHLCEYLHAASEKLGGGQKRWMGLQKKRLKNGRSEKVILALKELLEGDAVKDEEAPARAAYRYMTNHRNCFHYKEALEADLEIGSGLIESGNKHVLQARLKIPGASWAADSADAISQTRAFRANNNWCSYWNLRVA